MSMYSDKVMEHFKNPRNVGEIKNADGIGEVGNPICGDIMKIYIKVGTKNKEEYISDIKFETYGCIAAVATSSALTDLAKKETLKEALKINARDIVKSLGGMPAIKLHCSVLAQDALAEALYDYYKKHARAIPEKLMNLHKNIIERQKRL